MTRRYAVSVRGTVQGVGFRPFLHRLAERNALSGWVRNTGRGVELEWQGEEESVLSAVQTLRTAEALPPMAQVTECETREIPLEEEKGFRILPSRAGEQNTLIAPDIAPCEDCLAEMRDVKNRRYHYPFLNCTNCGPRFTIVKTIPYDRASTTMRTFPMCSDCSAEYGDIKNRRYHAQPTCCPECGPVLWFVGERGRLTAPSGRQNGEEREAVLTQAKQLIQEGKILAVRGVGGFHLTCRIDREDILRELRRRKCRPDKPFAVMCRDIRTVQHLCVLSPAERELLQSPRRPIVLLKKRERTSFPLLSKSDTLGVMLPCTPLHELLFEGTGWDTLVMTSANLSGIPVAIRNEEAWTQLKEIADGFLLHNREIEARCDDSLLQVVDEMPVFLRRSRGYVPQPIEISADVSGILALGAEQKASFALGRGRDVFYSPHIGDLKNAETLQHYEEQIRRFEALFGTKPHTLVCDLHPEFLSTRYAEERAKEERLTLLQVQHHHAHMAACMADNGLTGDVIGLIWDGTGLGTDGTIWGGEVLTGGYRAAKRAASLRPIPLLGGDAAVVRPERLALALAWEAGRADIVGMDETKKKLLTRMLDRGISVVFSSGMGRLFDGVYTLLTGQNEVTYDGQQAVGLETLAAAVPEEKGQYPIRCAPDEAGLLRWDWRIPIRRIADERENGGDVARIAKKFHNTLVEWAVRMCCRVREEKGLNRVVLGGGVFLNRILLHDVSVALRENGFSVYRPRRVSPGDEGIALGQLTIAREMQTTIDGRMIF